eukprot:SM000030S11314  [mRNA]  locus=s30:100807:103982:+ [translate_table: standard]
MALALEKLLPQYAGLRLGGGCPPASRGHGQIWIPADTPSCSSRPGGQQQCSRRSTAPSAKQHALLCQSGGRADQVAFFRSSPTSDSLESVSGPDEQDPLLEEVLDGVEAEDADLVLASSEEFAASDDDDGVLGELVEDEEEEDVEKLMSLPLETGTLNDILRAKLGDRFQQFIEVASLLSDMGVETLSVVKAAQYADAVPNVKVVKELVSELSKHGMGKADIARLFSRRPKAVQSSPASVAFKFVFLQALGMSRPSVVKTFVTCPPLLDFDLDNMAKVISFYSNSGVADADLARIVRRWPQLLGYSVDRLAQVVNFLINAGVTKEDIGRLLRKSPEVLALRVDRNLTSKVELLLSLGLTPIALGKALARRPAILSYSTNHLQVWSAPRMRLPNAEPPPLNTPPILGLCLQAAVNFLRDQGLSPSELGRLLQRFAEVLVLDPQKKQQPMVDYLITLGVKREDIGKVLLRRPQVLAFSVEGLHNVVDFLLSLGITPPHLARIVTAAPQVLTLSVEEKLKPMIAFLREVGVTDQKDLEKLVWRNAQILCCSIEKNLKLKIEYLKSVGIPDADVVRMIVMFPSMMGQALETSIGAKHDYLVKVMGRSVSEVIDFPQYFGYSLEARIRPRHETLQELGIRTSLASMLACVDEDFETRYVLKQPPQRAPYRSRRRSAEATLAAVAASVSSKLEADSGFLQEAEVEV